MILKCVLGAWVVCYVFLSFGLNDGIAGFLSVTFLIFVCSFPATFYMLYKYGHFEKHEVKDETREKSVMPWE